ncbi:MAG TPA: SEL1-like repeat protein, partial [Candidatus Lachnoclostridium stercoravium]|nr:SEL1-like repeat protein [Candidatus Lachnoclostridium stercoravium]
RFESQTGEQAVKIKHQLSSTENCREYILMGWESIPYEISAVHFNEMIAPLVGQTIDACHRILKSADLSVKDLSAVFMVGGTSRVPLVREMVQRFAGDVPVYSSVDLELAVAMGAVMGGGSREEEDEGEKWLQLGNKYYNSDSVEGNPEIAIEYYKKAAELGNITAQKILGHYYETYFNLPGHTSESLKWYRKAAEQGDAEVQYMLGFAYYHGDRVTRNYRVAAKWFRKAAEQGDAAAQDKLGFCYYYGLGVPQDYEEAVKWYRKAAEQGNMIAQNKLGVCYETGHGVLQDYEEAAKWYEKAGNEEKKISVLKKVRR